MAKKKTEPCRYLVVRLAPELFKRVEEASNYCGWVKTHFARIALHNLCSEVEKYREEQKELYKRDNEEDGEDGSR